MSDILKTHKKRYASTLKLIDKYFDQSDKILDVGAKNPFTSILEQNGYSVVNTGLSDLDLNPEVVNNIDAEVITALEILEHLVSPFPLLKNLPGKKLIATIPLKLWFAKAYKHPTNEWDRHYHEFEDWQFDWLLEKSGWEVVYREKWKAPTNKIGVRPFLRSITPRYYAVYAERKQSTF